MPASCVHNCSRATVVTYFCFVAFRSPPLAASRMLMMLWHTGVKSFQSADALAVESSSSNHAPLRATKRLFSRQEATRIAYRTCTEKESGSSGKVVYRQHDSDLRSSCVHPREVPLAKRDQPERRLHSGKVAGGELAADDSQLAHRALHRRQADVPEALAAHPLHMSEGGRANLQSVTPCWQ